MKKLIIGFLVIISCLIVFIFVNYDFQPTDVSPSFEPLTKEELAELFPQYEQDFNVVVEKFRKLGIMFFSVEFTYDGTTLEASKDEQTQYFLSDKQFMQALQRLHQMFSKGEDNYDIIVASEYYEEKHLNVYFEYYTDGVTTYEFTYEETNRSEENLDNEYINENWCYYWWTAV